MGAGGPTKSHANVVLGVQQLALQPAARAMACLRTAASVGVGWLDVADVYGRAPGDAETLLAPFATRIPVATKGGLRREGRRWVPDGRASHLTDAAQRSRDRLGVPAIARYFLHVPDPRVALKTSVAALAKLQARGIVEQVGLSNVTVHQLQQALDHVHVDCVQVPLSPLDTSSLASGIVEVCLARGIDVWAYRPLGGRDRVARLTKKPVLADVAAQLGCSPMALVLAWLRDLGVQPLPGPTQLATVRDCVAAHALRLTADSTLR